jgi:hypothetical protein
MAVTQAILPQTTPETGSEGSNGGSSSSSTASTANHNGVADGYDENISRGTSGGGASARHGKSQAQRKGTSKNAKKRGRSNSTLYEAKLLAWSLVRNKVGAGRIDQNRKVESTRGDSNALLGSPLDATKLRSTIVLPPIAEPPGLLLPPKVLVVKSSPQGLVVGSLRSAFEIETKESVDLLLSPCKFDAKFGPERGEEPERHADSQTQLRNWAHEITGVNAANDRYKTTAKTHFPVLQFEIRGRIARTRTLFGSCCCYTYRRKIHISESKQVD